MFILGPKSVKNYLNNSQKHLWSVKKTSKILLFHILQKTLEARNYLKEFEGGSESVIYYLMSCSNNRGSYKTGDGPKKVLSNPQKGSIEPPFGPHKGSIEPQ